MDSAASPAAAVDLGVERVHGQVRAGVGLGPALLGRLRQTGQKITGQRARALEGAKKREKGRKKGEESAFLLLKAAIIVRSR